MKPSVGLLTPLIFCLLASAALAGDAQEAKPDHPASAAYNQIVIAGGRKANPDCPRCTALQASLMEEWQEATEVSEEDNAYLLQKAHEAALRGGRMSQEEMMVPITRKMTAFVDKHRDRIAAPPDDSLCGECVPVYREAGEPSRR